MHLGQSVYNLWTTTHVLIDTRIDKTEVGYHFGLVSLLYLLYPLGHGRINY